jgi:hypothetical protein
VAELGGELQVALVGLHLDEHRKVEGVHQAEAGEVETGGHGELLGRCGESLNPAGGCRRIVSTRGNSSKERMAAPDAIASELSGSP